MTKKPNVKQALLYKRLCNDWWGVRPWIIKQSLQTCDWDEQRALNYMHATFEPPGFLVFRWLYGAVAIACVVAIVAVWLKSPPRR